MTLYYIRVHPRKCTIDLCLHVTFYWPFLRCLNVEETENSPCSVTGRQWFHWASWWRMNNANGFCILCSVSPQNGARVSWVLTPCAGAASRPGCSIVFAAMANLWTWNSARRWEFVRILLFVHRAFLFVWAVKFFTVVLWRANFFSITLSYIIVPFKDY